MKGNAAELLNADFGIEEVDIGQFRVVSRLFIGDPQGSASQLQISDCGMNTQRRDRQGAVGASERHALKNAHSRTVVPLIPAPRITDHEARTAPKLSGRTNPFGRKTKAAKEKE